MELTHYSWGVARDDRRAFNELRQACEDSLNGERLDLGRNAGAVMLTMQQNHTLTVRLPEIISQYSTSRTWVDLLLRQLAKQKDFLLGLFEIANCFLEGVGVKRSPEIALAYLRSAGNMGDLASQERKVFEFVAVVKRADGKQNWVSCYLRE